MVHSLMLRAAQTITTTRSPATGTSNLTRKKKTTKIAKKTKRKKPPHAIDSVPKTVCSRQHSRQHKTSLHEADARRKQTKNLVDPFDLEGMNKVVEDSVTNMEQELPPEIWDQWLWETDLNEPPDSISLLNRCQLLGLIICRYRAARQDPWMSPITLSPGRLVIINKPPSKMTLRELRDSMSNLFLLWGKDIHSNKTNVQSGQIHMFLDACFHRLGELAWATWPCGSQVSGGGGVCIQ